MPFQILNKEVLNNGVSPMLQAQEKSLTAATPIDTSKTVSSPSSLFQKYIDTGDSIFKDAAGAALGSLHKAASGIFDAVTYPISAHISVTDNTPTEMTDAQKAAKQQQQMRDKIVQAIANNETGIVKDNPYIFTKYSGNPSLGRALGKYQVTEGELQTYAKRFLGQPTTSAEFLASPQLQDQYMTNKVEYLQKQGDTPAEIFNAHRGGMSQTKINYKGYVDKGLKFIGETASF